MPPWSLSSLPTLRTLESALPYRNSKLFGLEENDFTSPVPEQLVFFHITSSTSPFSRAMLHLFSQGKELPSEGRQNSEAGWIDSP